MNPWMNMHVLYLGVRQTAAKNHDLDLTKKQVNYDFNTTYNYS